MHIEHCAIWTADLERLRAFYETYFRARSGPKYTNPAKHFESYFLAFESGARLELMCRPALAALSSSDAFCGYAHIAFSLGSKEAVHALTERLQQDGYTLLNGPRTTGDGYYESLFLDPDGNRLEITV
ncbi:MAG: VOC family protein [Chloroflexota bacterium]